LNDIHFKGTGGDGFQDAVGGGTSKPHIFSFVFEMSDVQVMDERHIATPHG
jgi:hypothetical protein